LNISTSFSERKKERKEKSKAHPDYIFEAGERSNRESSTQE
jgi:hypothetical protein